MRLWHGRFGAVQWLEFVRLELLSCLFPIVIFGSLALSRWVHLPVARYDLLLLICLLTQWLMWRFGLESSDELKVICVFHLLGIALEMFKVGMGSWAYPEPGFSKVLGVPLYSGFMYASIASYLCQAWRHFDLSLSDWPDSRLPSLLAAAVYINFYAHHVLPDARWFLAGMTFVAFLRTRVWFSVGRDRHWMPLGLSFVLIGFFVWVAENIGTLLGAWIYPHQQKGWQVVDIGKWSAWSLLVIVSLIVVAALKDLKAQRSSQLNQTARLHPRELDPKLEA